MGGLIGGIWGPAFCMWNSFNFRNGLEIRDPRDSVFFDNSLKSWVFWAETKTESFRFLGDHFARVESSGDQNLTMFILHFHVFFHF